MDIANIRNMVINCSVSQSAVSCTDRLGLETSLLVIGRRKVEHIPTFTAIVLECCLLWTGWQTYLGQCFRSLQLSGQPDVHGSYKEQLSTLSDVVIYLEHACLIDGQSQPWL